MITYTSETRVLKESVKQKLLITERNILRRIFRLTNDRDGTRRIKMNGELNDLVRNTNIITYIKAQRLSWSGLVHWMTKDRMVKKLWVETDIKRRFKNYENK